MMDSSCTRRVSKNRAHFRDFSEYDGVIQVVNNKIIRSCGLGTVIMDNVVNGEIKHVTINHVIHDPENMYNLI